MYIERTNNEIIIRLPSIINTEGLQRLVDFLTYKEITANSKAKQKDVDELASEVNRTWWTKNKKRFIK